VGLRISTAGRKARWVIRNRAAGHRTDGGGVAMRRALRVSDRRKAIPRAAARRSLARCRPPGAIFGRLKRWSGSGPSSAGSRLALDGQWTPRHSMHRLHRGSSIPVPRPGPEQTALGRKAWTFRPEQPSEPPLGAHVPGRTGKNRRHGPRRRPHRPAGALPPGLSVGQTRPQRAFGPQAQFSQAATEKQFENRMKRGTGRGISG
jgi:hypothetical protein